MCDTCGCGQPGEQITIRRAGEESDQGHWHGEVYHEHSPDPAGHVHDHTGRDRVVEVEQDVLGQNNLLAERNRGYFEAKHIRALNLVSSPGSGKTTLLEKSILALAGEIPCAVIEGDQQTMHDANRILATGATAVQVNTGTGCHLDADMIHKALQTLDPQEHSLLFIENVGNLVCPALFDLGEAAKVVVISVTEGDDKPLKYPTMFDASDLCIINKMDLLPHVDFDVQKCRDYALQVNPDLQFMELSARTGEGLDTWLNWLQQGKLD